MGACLSSFAMQAEVLRALMNQLLGSGGQVKDHERDTLGFGKIGKLCA